MITPQNAPTNDAPREMDPVTVHVQGDRDSFTLDAGAHFAGASDLGLRHRNNQDALAIAVVPSLSGTVNVIAVSDGVSSSEFADQAAAVAADAACCELAVILEQSTQTPEALTAAMVDAFMQAQADVVEAAGSAPGGAWACTLICAAMFEQQVLVGNAGDSRCYWIPDLGEPLLLTADDSVAADQIRQGIRREIAEASSAAHAITKWLGPGAHNVVPSVQLHAIDQAGWLVLCSDGLWNYASRAQQLRAVLHSAKPSRDGATIGAKQLAEYLVQWANVQGGRDNITVAVLRVSDANTN